jgi:class 3 adenylate cyclase
MTTKRRPQASASKRTALDRVSPMTVSAKAVEGLRAMFVADPHGTPPADELLEAREGTGVEPPLPSGLAPNHLKRSFLFVDVSGFTAYVDRHGEHAAIEVLTHFRSEVRDVAARRGVRVGKWLGDGVMLVGIEPSVTAAAAAELFCRFDDSGIDIHGGLASGPVLLFEGDDYIGRPVNLAARLCDAAAAGELLADIDEEQLPDWVRSAGRVTVQIAGVGDVSGVHQLVVAPEALAEFKAGGAAA